MGTVSQKSPVAPTSATPPLPLRMRRAVLWIIMFAVAEYVFSFRQLAAIVPGTVLRLISIPLALLAVALILRPARQAPIYGLIYIAIGLLREMSAPHLEFSIVRLLIEALEMMFIVWVLFGYFFDRLVDPVMVGAWAITVLIISAISATFMIIALRLLPTDPPDYMRALGGSLGVAWRNWWLGDAATFLALAGPAATLVNLRHRLKLLLRTPGSDRRRFVGVAASLVATALFAFRLADLPWLGFPPDVVLAVRLLPVPFAMAMAARFRANGAAIAILIFTLIGAYSATVRGAHAAGPAVPMPATPRQTLILITTITCMVLAVISRQLKLALNHAVEASEIKSRFIAMLNHELRTPLNAILGFTELMRLQQLRELGQAMSPIENIHASGQRLLAMIEGLLSATDHGASVFSLEKQRIDVGAFITDLVEEMRGEFAEAGVNVEIAAEPHLMIDADPRALKQILHVLVTFPLRFPGPGGSIRIGAGHVGTDTAIEVNSSGLINAAADDRDKLEMQLAEALALAHGARLRVVETTRTSRRARLIFFATRAAG